MMQADIVLIDIRQDRLHATQLPGPNVNVAGDLGKCHGRGRIYIVTFGCQSQPNFQGQM
jgi:hypothetical protein